MTIFSLLLRTYLATPRRRARHCCLLRATRVQAPGLRDPLNPRGCKQQRVADSYGPQGWWRPGALSLNLDEGL